VAAGLLLVAAGLWVWRTFFPSPEAVIHQRLEKLARNASFSAGEGTVARAISAQRVPGFFAPQVDVILDFPGRPKHTFADRERVAEAAMASRQGMGLSVKFPDINVVVNGDRKSATADVTLQARLAEDKEDIIQELQITFQKTNDDWLITRVQSVRPLTLQ
jgi:ketosteroid isomerase-like protein